MRRESLLCFLEKNKSNMSLDKRFIDLFLNELGLAFMAQGIQGLCLAEPNRFYHSNLTRVLQNLHVHCDSDEDLWAALTLGCLRVSDIPTEASGVPVGDWWLPSLEPPTFRAVVNRWEGSMDWAARQTALRKGADGRSLYDILVRLESLCEEDEAMEMVEFATAKVARTQELADRWDKMMRRA